jgi:ubiquinol-cytochrome c reductase cytochrome b subunit
MKAKTNRVYPTNEPPRFFWELWRDPGPKYIPYFWEELISQIMIFFLLLGVMGGLALLWPAGLAEPANTLVTPAGIKPEWYFDGLFQLLKIKSLPEIATLVGVAVVFLLMIILPFVDRSKERNPLRKPVTTTIALILLIGLVALTIWGAVSS